MSEVLWMRRAVVLFAAALVCAAAQHAAALKMSESWRFESKSSIGTLTLFRATERGPVEGVVFAVADGRLVRLDGKGRVVWARPVARLSDAVPAVADVDGDGKCEIVFADFDGIMHCLSGDGSVKWTQELRGGVSGMGGAGICDLDGDGRKEIVVGDRGGKVWCLNGQGQVRWTLDAGQRYLSMPTFADLDGDGKREIIIGAVDKHLYCLDSSGRWRWEMWRRDDVFGYSASTVADLTNDGVPDVAVGGGHNHFLALDGRNGKYICEINTLQHINSAMAGADLDRDGRTDVVFGTRQGTLYRIGEQGRVVWQKQFPNAVFATPCIADLADNDGYEIIVAPLHHNLVVLDCGGNEIAQFPFVGGGEARPAVGDVDGDGRLDILLPDARAADLVCLRTDAPAKKNAVAWESMRGDAACTGNPQNIRAARPTAAPIAESRSKRMTREGAIRWFAGNNEWAYRIQNPGAKRLLVSFECKKPGGIVERAFRRAERSADLVKCAVSVDRSGRYLLDAQVLDADSRVLLDSDHFSENVDLFSRDLKYAEGALPRLDKMMLDLQGEGAAILERLQQARFEVRGHIDRLREARRQRISPERAAGIIAEVTASRGRIHRALALADVISRRKQAGLNPTFVVWPAFSWHSFDCKNAVPPSGPARSIDIEAYVGEREWAAINITSFADRTARYRAEVLPAKGQQAGAEMPVDSFGLFEAIDAPTVDSRMVADALVPLGDSQMVTVAPWESRQVWVRLWPRNATPGLSKATLRITSVQPVPKSEEIELRARIWPIEIPSPGRLRFVNWVVSSGKGEDFNDELAREVMEHGVNVFPFSAPAAVFDSSGRLTAPIDYSPYDPFLKRFAGRGKFLFSTPQHCMRVEGAEMFSEKWVAAYRQYLSEWTQHLAQMGIRTQDFFLYPVDEASIAGSPDLIELTQTARITKQVAPAIGIFANPSMGATVAGLTELGQYVDVWCPSQELMDREGQPLLDFFKRTAREVWFYDARGPSRTLSGLAFFRRQAWQAWHHGLQGMGFYACMASPDLAWIGPHSDYFDVVYPGSKPISSKRYEGSADGREDFEAMAILREAAQKAKAAGLHAEAVREAEELLTSGAEKIWLAVDALEDRCEVLTDGSEAREAWQMLRAFRRQVAELTLALTAR
jgi:hypothetical protein